jgi:hypothetical protein
MLEVEMSFYDAHREEWLAGHPGKFVLVKSEKLLGVFDTQEEALAAGARLFGLESFLVRRVEKESAQVYVPALSLGLLRADPKPSV